MRRMADSRRGRLTGGAVALLLVLCLAGCSSSGAVSGKVTYKGEPLRQGSVLFVAADGWTGSALINEDGTYRMVNLPPGTFKVAVESSASLTQGGRGSKGPPGGKWRPPKDAPVPKEVEEAVHNTPRQVSGPPKLPAKYSKAETSGLTCEVKGGKQTYDINLE